MTGEDVPAHSDGDVTLLRPPVQGQQVRAQTAGWLQTTHTWGGHVRHTQTEAEVRDTHRDTHRDNDTHRHRRIQKRTETTRRKNWEWINHEAIRSI